MSRPDGVTVVSIGGSLAVIMARVRLDLVCTRSGRSPNVGRCLRIRENARLFVYGGVLTVAVPGAFG